MYLIKHRINKVKQLKKVQNDGVEVDLRYHKNEIILHVGHENVQDYYLEGRL